MGINNHIPRSSFSKKIKEEVAKEPEKAPTTEPVDFSKMDTRTLRSLVSVQGMHTSDAIGKMKKHELVKFLSNPK